MARTTKQSRVLRNILSDSTRPLSPMELLELATPRVPGLSLATVYRVLRRLMDEHEVVAVPLPGQPDRYELASVAAHHHHHFQCDSCQRVFDVPGCQGISADTIPPGFLVTHHHVVLSGTCNGCQPNGSPRA